MNQPNCVVSPSFLFFREEHRDLLPLTVHGEWARLDSAGQVFMGGTNVLPTALKFLSEFPVWRIGP